MLNISAAIRRMMPGLFDRGGAARQSWDRRRRSRGINVTWAGMLRHERFTRPACIRNISADGLMAEVDVIARPGDRAEIIVYGYGSIAGTIRWYNQGRIGMEFDTPVMLDRMLQARPGGKTAG